jgi:hypothetical protein
MDGQKFLALTVVLCIAALSASTSFAETPELPDKVTAPEVHPPPAGNIPPEHLGDTPVPEARPDGAASGENGKPAETPAVKEPAERSEPATPQTAPLPQEAPQPAEPPAKAPLPSDPHPPASGQDVLPKPAYEPDPRSDESPSKTMPPSEISCRQRLRELGVEFADRPAESSEDGCSLPYPMSVRSLGKGVVLEPEALMNCAMAEAAADFTKDVIAPAAKREFEAELTSISQASAYVCRPRNGTAKLSEHAFGNALDIARFGLSGGKAVDVIPRPEEREARFLGAVRKAACGPFKTVLGPGSNADHETHLHLDLAPRKHGGTVCE